MLVQKIVEWTLEKILSHSIKWNFFSSFPSHKRIFIVFSNLLITLIGLQKCKICFNVDFFFVCDSLSCAGFWNYNLKLCKCEIFALNFDSGVIWWDVLGKIIHLLALVLLIPCLVCLIHFFNLYITNTSITLYWLHILFDIIRCITIT